MRPRNQQRWLLICFSVGIAPFLVNGVINPLLASRPHWYWAFELGTWVLLPVLVGAAAWAKGGLVPSQVGLSLTIRGERNLPLLFLMCLSAGPVYLFIYSSALEFFRQFIGGEALFAYQSVMPASGFLRIVEALYFAITAGLVEEFFFRGLLFRVSETVVHPIALYMVASPILFALVHWEGTPAAIPANFVIGIFLSAAFLVIRNLWPLIIGHIYADFYWFVVT